jgi:adenine-specific DNA-methyltransferase
VRINHSQTASIQTVGFDSHFHDLEAIRLELSRNRLLCRAWAQSVPDKNRTALAAIFARRAIEAFSHGATPEIKLSNWFSEPEGRLDRAALQLAESIGRGSAELPVTEGLNFVTNIYPALLGSHERGALGAFYTPPVLSARLLDQATEHGVEWNIARILDPAAGSGAFLVQAALRMRDALADCEPALALAQIGSRLLGLEIDPNAAAIAQAALEITLADLISASGRQAPLMLRVCDTLQEEAAEIFDLVIGNPPYGRVTLSPELRRTYARSLYGHANLYGLFTDAALRWTKPDGLIAFLTPTSFLAGQYYRALRGLLANEAPPLSIDFVHARRGVFEDVLQETLLATYQKGSAARRAQIHYLHIADEREAQITRNGTIGLPSDPIAPWLAPREPKHGELIRCAETMRARLSDWGYSVSTGPLVWNRFKKQMRDRKVHRGVYPLVWAEAVTADGHFVFRADKKNHSPYFEIGPGDLWLLVQEPCVLVQRTTAKEQMRRLIAAELPAVFVETHGGVIVENHLNMVRASRPGSVPLPVVAAMLNSKVVDDVFRCMNGSVAVSAFELEALPLPDPSSLDELTDLVTNNANRFLVDAECARLYDKANRY